MSWIEASQSTKLGGTDSVRRIVAGLGEDLIQSWCWTMNADRISIPTKKSPFDQRNLPISLSLLVLDYIVIVGNGMIFGNSFPPVPTLRIRITADSWLFNQNTVQSFFSPVFCNSPLSFWVISIGKWFDIIEVDMNIHQHQPAGMSFPVFWSNLRSFRKPVS